MALCGETSDGDPRAQAPATWPLGFAHLGRRLHLYLPVPTTARALSGSCRPMVGPPPAPRGRRTCVMRVACRKLGLLARSLGVRLRGGSQSKSRPSSVGPRDLLAYHHSSSARMSGAWQPSFHLPCTIPGCLSRSGERVCETRPSEGGSLGVVGIGSHPKFPASIDSPVDPLRVPGIKVVR